jgi:hypothetical protein
MALATEAGATEAAAAWVPRGQGAQAATSDAVTLTLSLALALTLTRTLTPTLTLTLNPLRPLLAWRRQRRSRCSLPRPCLWLRLDGCSRPGGAPRV